ncbi:hypothetical protein LCGC14_0275580 [marine sediment metagenome]|uniref:Uncharacterized protein n=1 Tax=marine sediment metagenome TaxID=412755 RepID=A0A0F9X2Q8_9ZZZZ
MPKKAGDKMRSDHGRLVLRLGDFLLRQLDPMAEQKRLEADRVVRSLDCPPLTFVVKEGCVQVENEDE